MRRLHLTTPLMHGEDVKEAQHRLAKSRFGDFHPGRADGQFGPHSAAATKRAKYWLGYRKGRVNSTYGEVLDRHLRGEKLGHLKRVRRAARLWRAKHLNPRRHMLRIAETQIGVSEYPPNSNVVKYSRWYGEIGPWCAMFVSWCAWKAGLHFHYAYVPDVVLDARAGRNGLRAISSHEVEPGDFACYVWGGPDSNPLGDHIGIVKVWVIGGEEFLAIEGNTENSGDQSTGGNVLQQTRYVDQVVQFVRIES